MPDEEEMNRRLVEFAESPNCRFWNTEFAKLSACEVVFGLVWELEGEVNSGGFQQYFHNSSGSFAPYVVDALRRLGAMKTAELAERAIGAVGSSVPWSDDEARQAKIAALPAAIEDELEALDNAFFARPDNLTTLLYKYVSDHRHEIGAPEDF
jgi:hypothetical protein